MDAMEEHVKNGKLREYEVFLLTYNLVTENALYKDSSSNNMLLNLIDQVMEIIIGRRDHIGRNPCAGKEDDCLRSKRAVQRKYHERYHTGK